MTVCQRYSDRFLGQAAEIIGQDIVLSFSVPMHRKENERLKRLRGGHTTTVAKRYKLPERAIEIIEQAGKIHGQQSRAIQIAVEIIYRTQRKTTQRPLPSQTRPDRQDLRAPA